MNIKEQILKTREKSTMTNSPLERKSGELFVGAVDKILAQKDFKDNSPVSLGVEIEFGLTTPDLIPVSEQVRDDIMLSANQVAKVRGGEWSFQPEMGASQIEANQEVSAILPAGFNPDDLIKLFQNLDNILVPVTHENDAQVLGMGLHPTSKLAGLDRTTKTKYIHVPNHHIKNRIEGTELDETLGLSIDPDASAVGLSQALQFNMSVESPDQGVDIVNWMLQMSPSILAITANSRVAGGVDTQWNEPRNMIWDKTHTTELGHRVFMPENFFGNLEDLFERMGRFPLILEPDNEEVALAISTGLNWLGGKLKFLTEGDDLAIKKILAEFRPMSTQPSPEANAAAVMLSFGRLRWAVQNNEELMPFEAVEFNSDQAMKNGVAGKFIITDDNGTRMVDWSEMRTLEVTRAVEGLVNEGHGTTSELMEFFNENLPKIPTSEKLVNELEKRGGIKNREILKDTLIRTLNDLDILR